MAKLIIAKKDGSVSDSEKDLALISDDDCLIEIANGNVDVATSGGSGSGSYSHGLGYAPAYDCFVRDPDNTGRWFPANGTIDLGSGTTYFKYPKTYADDSAINFLASLYPTSPDKTLRFHYIVYANRPEGGIATGKNNVSGILKVAKSGVNLETAQDARQLAFMSGASVPKQDPNLKGSGSIVIPAATGGGNGYAIATINHNLNYVPRAHVLETNDGYQLPVDTYILGDDYALTFYITSTTLVIQALNYGFVQKTINYKYNILRDKIA